MKIPPLNHAISVVSLVCFGAGCATGIYDSVLDGLNKIAEVHFKPDRPVSAYAGPWRSREPGNTYGHETPPKSAQIASRGSAQPPTSTSMAPPSTGYVPPSQDRPHEENAATIPAAPPPVPLSANTQTAGAEVDALEREIWQHYKRFEFPEVFTTGTKLAYLPAAAPSQRAMAFILMGSVACIQNHGQEAREHFLHAIQADPTRLPDKAVFSSRVCRLYREVADGCTQNP